MPNGAASEDAGSSIRDLLKLVNSLIFGIINQVKCKNLGV